MPMLIAIDGPMKGRRFPLAGQTLIGRSLQTDIRIPDLVVTRRHCLISEGPEGFVIEDLGSRNGTWLNDQRVRRPTPLNDGDVIRIHDAVFRFHRGSEAEGAVELVDPPRGADSRILEAVATKPSALEEAGSGTPEVLARANRRLRTALEIGGALAAHLELDRLLEEVMNSLFGLFPTADRGFIMLRDEPSGEMRVRIARHRTGPQDESIAVSRRIVNEAVQQRAGILSADAMEDTRFADARSVVNFRIRSMMCAPLMNRNQVIGIVHVDTVRGVSHFTREDLELFTAVANQTALAIANVRAHEELRRRQRMQYDLALARHVQHSFLPDAPPQLPGLKFSAAYQAALEVGGDFYDFIPLRDGRIGVLVGDVMGKGMPAALMMARMMSDFRLLATNETDPARVLERINSGLVRRATRENFVTAALLFLDPTTRRVVVANAAHCPPVLRKARSGKVVEIGQEESGFPLGTDEDMRYSQFTLALDPGDCLLLYTDGLTEAQNAEDDLYGIERLMAALRSPPSSPAAVVERLLDEVHEFVGDAPVTDDLTILCCLACR